MAMRSIVHIEIPASDQLAAARFYNSLFDWETEHMPEMNYTTFRSGNVGGGFAQVGEMAEVGDVRIYLESDDIDQDLRKIEGLGGRTMMPKTEIPNTGYFAIFSDPTGNQVGLYTPLAP